jgi:hypothetical protein
MVKTGNRFGAKMKYHWTIRFLLEVEDGPLSTVKMGTTAEELRIL